MKMPGAMKSGQWKGLGCNDKYPMKSVDSNENPPMKYSALQWKVLNENSWPAMKSSQWKGLASNEKWLMKMAGLQWKAANDKLWPAMKSYWKAQGLLWKNVHNKRAWDLYDILFMKLCGWYSSDSASTIVWAFLNKGQSLIILPSKYLCHHQIVHTVSKTL